jgi:hypothetical protein
MQDLLSHLDMQFDQYRFSKKFKNESLEKEFEDHFHTDISSLAAITLYGYYVVGAIIFLWYIFRII